MTNCIFGGFLLRIHCFHSKLITFNAITIIISVLIIINNLQYDQHHIIIVYTQVQIITYGAPEMSAYLAMSLAGEWWPMIHFSFP